MGTSGGLGLPPGSIVVSTDALDGLLRPHHRQVILGKVVHRPGKFDDRVSKMLGVLGVPVAWFLACVSTHPSEPCIQIEHAH